MLKNKKFITLQIFFLLFIILCLGLSLLFYGKITLHSSINLSMSMAWNVFLALLAYDFAYLCVQAKNKILKVCYGFLWLIFYPNTFYVLTDAKHFVDWLNPAKVEALSDNRTIVDFNVLIFGIIFGVVLGIWSIQLMLEAYLKHWSLKVLVVSLISFLSSIGIYVGRSEALRLNSWDLVLHPLKTLFLILKSINGQNLGFFASFTLCQIALITLIYLAPQLSVKRAEKKA